MKSWQIGLAMSQKVKYNAIMHKPTYTCRATDRHPWLNCFIYILEYMHETFKSASPMQRHWREGTAMHSTRVDREERGAHANHVAYFELVHRHIWSTASLHMQFHYGWSHAWTVKEPHLPNPGNTALCNWTHGTATVHFRSSTNCSLVTICSAIVECNKL